MTKHSAVSGQPLASEDRCEHSERCIRFGAPKPSLADGSWLTADGFQGNEK
jgi:hypothetical protein